ELLAPEDIRRESLAGASFANFGSIPLIKDPVRSATRKFAQLAIEMDVPVAFDVNLREHLWTSLDAFREAIEPMLGLATVIKLSADELAPVLGTEDPQEGAGMLLSRGATLAHVSMGHQGAFYATKTFHGTAPAFEPERVLDATGAGDAFLAATLVHLAETPGWREHQPSVHEAVRRGTAAGAMACAEFGAMPGLPTRDKLDQFIAARTQSHTR
ncbi:MAG: PfkB family carbohydrate kinase, partial [Solirubrobacteraceae bacterium]